jgi:putative membrane protein
VDKSDFGIWAMLAFWGSAIGGIALGVAWARARRHNPVRRDLIERSLKRRLEKGEIDEAEYERRLASLDDGKPGKAAD